MGKAMIERLEGRRLLTSQRVKVLDDGQFRWTINGVGYEYDSIEPKLRSVDLLTGKSASVNTNGYQVDYPAFSTTSRVYFNLYDEGGVGVIENDKVISLIPGQKYDSDYSVPLEVDNRVYFVTRDATYDDYTWTAWVSDGTTKGTRAISEVPGYSPTTFVAWAGGRAYFTATRDQGDNEVLMSVAPGDTTPRVDFTPSPTSDYDRSDIRGTFRLGNGVLVLYGIDASTTAYKYVEGQRRQDFSIGSLKDVWFLKSSEGADAELIGDTIHPGGGDLLFKARTKALGFQVYAIDGATRQIRNCSNAGKGQVNADLAIPLDAPGKDALDGDRRYLVVEDWGEGENSIDYFDAPEAHASGTFIVDPVRGSYTRISLAQATGVYTTSEGTFIEMNDSGVWKLDLKTASATPVASSVYVRGVVAGKLLMGQYGDENWSSTLRDVTPILSARAVEDADQDGTCDLAEVARGHVVYVDLNRNGKLDAKEPSQTARGPYCYFDRLGPGTYDIRVKANGWSLPNDAAYRVTRTVGDRQTPATADFALTRTIPELWVQAFRDKDGDGIRDSNEDLWSATIYLDDNRDKRPDSQSPTPTDVQVPKPIPILSSFQIFDHQLLRPLTSGKHSLRVIWTDPVTRQSIYRLIVIHIHAGINRLSVAL